MTQRIIDLIRDAGPLSRAELSRRGNVSKPTVSAVVKTLLEANLIYEDGLEATSGGRPSRLLQFNAKAGYVIGMDIGGSRARAAIADLKGEILSAIVETTEARDTPKLVTQVEGLCSRLTEAIEVDVEDVRAVAIGTPGVVNPQSGELQYAHNLPALESAGAVQALRAQLHPPLFIVNDVNLAALGERWSGAAQAHRHFAFISIGTGLGFGLVVNGSLYSGMDGRAGEFGYLPFFTSGSETLEDRLSGPGLAARHRAAGGSGRPEDAFDEADRGVSPGRAIIDEFLADLAWTVTALGTLLDPECVILGGSLGVRCEPYLASLSQRIQVLTPISPNLKVSSLAGDAGIQGAISVAVSESQSVRKWLKGGTIRS